MRPSAPPSERDSSDSGGALEEQQVFRGCAVVHVGRRRERAELEAERREAVVRNPRVVDARRTFGAGAAELQQQPVVEVARDGAFDAETRAPEIEAIAEVARGAVFAVGYSAHRAAAKVRGRAGPPATRHTAHRRAARWRETRSRSGRRRP